MTPDVSEVFQIEVGAALEQHPLSAYWPPMDPETFRDLVDSIRGGGIKTPIILYEGKVLDGWHRYNAGVIVGIEIPAVEYDGDDPAGMVIEANQLRRHLAPGERAKAVLASRNWQPSGRPRKDIDTPRLRSGLERIESWRGRRAYLIARCRENANGSILTKVRQMAYFWEILPIQDRNYRMIPVLTKTSRLIRSTMIQVTIGKTSRILRFRRNRRNRRTLARLQRKRPHRLRRRPQNGSQGAQ